VVVGALLLLTVLSPLGLVVAAVLFGIGLIGLVVRVAQRRSIEGWGIVAVGSLALVFAFGGISDALYGTGFVQSTGSSVGTDPKSGSTGSTAKGSSKASDTEDLKPDERRYLQRTAEISWEIGKIASRQVELYNFCVQLCVPQSFNEMHRNMERSSKLLKDAKALAPPAGYEQSYDAFASGAETANQLNQRIALFAIGGAEGDSRSTKAAAHFARAHDLAPERGQRFYEEYGRSHPVPNA
jgi:23S rRNA pseudoU1915 N3-methylase RlmH